MATTNIRKWGNSQGITIPKSMLGKLHWLATEPVEIIAFNKQIVIKQKIKNKN